jgi:UDP-N-acetylmuramyl pentapeptide phosphotransferase/UDP-N-acetylglucosamine-1-phosphate transferase
VKEIVLGFLTSFFVVIITTPSLIKVAKLKHLVDVPTEDRKLHSRRVPTIGGIIIFAAILFSFTIWIPINPFLDSVTLAARGNEIKYLTAALIILFFIGIKDDIIGVSPAKKLIGLGLVGFILVVMGDFRIVDFDGLLGLNEIPYWASVLLSFFVYIVVVNAFNLIDGVDGLAASEGFLIGVLFGTWFYLNDNPTLALLAFTLSGAMLGFLFFNFSPAKIFMGDSGSMTIGAITSLLAIWLISIDNSNMIYPLNEMKTPIVAMTILAYPLTDTLRIFALRIFKGMSPFSADRNHIHHCLQRNGFSDRAVVFIILLFNIIMVVTAILTASLNPNLSLLILAIADVLMVTIMLKVKLKHGVKA